MYTTTRLPDADACYQALLAHDARFDGAFFVGVSTTGIYCRTVCTARTPRRDRCTFYPSAAASERAGFRPCLRCRPELAPGKARVDAVGRLAARAAGRIEEGVLAEKGVAGLAAEIGVSERHLRRVIAGEYGVSPVELAQTQRLLLAKRLLAETTLGVGEIAFASGFSSLRRFNALFRERYRLNPTALRRAREMLTPPETLVCELAYRPPLAWEPLAAFLGARGACGVEAWESGEPYRRTASFGQHLGWIAVTPAPDRDTMRVEVSASLAPVLRAVLTRVKRLFDLDAEPNTIAVHLGALAAARPGLRVPGAWDGFEAATRAILGQQVSVTAATTLAGRLAQAFGESVETPFDSLTRLTPTAARVAEAGDDELIGLGILPARARSILALARAVAGGEIVLESGVDVEDTTARLKALPGVGEWTAQYIALRALAWPDAFPHTDLGLLKALGVGAKDALVRAEAWRPWRSYAALHLWQSLEENP